VSDIVKIKICCIQSIEEAELSIKYGASAIGLVSEMPSGPGVISEDKIAEIIFHLPKQTNTFLLTSKVNADDIIKQCNRCKPATVQIVDSVKIGVYKKVRNSLPEIKIIQVIHVSGEGSIDEAIKIEKYVDALLLDSGNQNLFVKELGGTGRTHNWEISKKIVELVNTPVYLAGGINTDNVNDAIEKVKPFGVDLCNGVRTNGKLDEVKLKSFFSKLNSFN